MKIKLLMFLGLSCLIIFTEGCTSAGKSVAKQDTSISTLKTNLNVLSINGIIRSSIEGQNVSADCRMILAGTDSASMTLLGPLGMLVGKLYARPDYFVFYNTLTSEAFEGRPTADNLNKILKVPLDFVEFARLLRNEIPNDASKFSKSEIEGGNLLLKMVVDTSYIEYCMMSPDMTKLLQYQRKSLDGSMIMNIVFQDFKEFDSFTLPTKFVMKFPVMNGNVTIEAEDISINSPIEKAFIFTAPKSFKKYILD